MSIRIAVKVVALAALRTYFLRNHTIIHFVIPCTRRQRIAIWNGRNMVKLFGQCSISVTASFRAVVSAMRAAMPFFPVFWLPRPFIIAIRAWKMNNIPVTNDQCFKVDTISPVPFLVPERSKHRVLIYIIVLTGLATWSLRKIWDLSSFSVPVLTFKDSVFIACWK